MEHGPSEPTTSIHERTLRTARTLHKKTGKVGHINRQSIHIPPKNMHSNSAAWRAHGDDCYVMTVRHAHLLLLWDSQSHSGHGRRHRDALAIAAVIGKSGFSRAACGAGGDDSVRIGG